MTTAPTDSPFIPTPGGSRIILLDLQGTLTIPPSNNPTIDNIKKLEKYKDWLIAALPDIQQSGWEVHIFTVRNDDRREATLESIKRETGWQPDAVWFNDLGVRGAPNVKSTLLTRLIEQRHPGALYAFESNGESREMFKRRDVRCRRIHSRKALEQALLEISQM